MMAKIAPLPPDALYRHCDPGQFAFASAADLDTDIHIIGQERAANRFRNCGVPKSTASHW